MILILSVAEHSAVGDTGGKAALLVSIIGLTPRAVVLDLYVDRKIFGRVL